MADIKSKEARSRNMAAIKNKNTKPEEIVRKYLFSQGFRYRKNVSSLVGHPDIVLPKYHTIIFVNGCFWHGHIGCKYFILPSSNVEFWKSKIDANQARDKRVKSELTNTGWKVITVWECELKRNFREERLARLCQEILQE